MSDAPLPDIRHAIDIDAPREFVWQTMTSPAEVPKWLGCLNYLGKVGSTFHMQPDRAKFAAGDIAGATWCDIEAMQAPELFAFTWYMPDTPKTLVTIRLHAVTPLQTRVELVHTGWSQFPPAMVGAIHAMLEGGWKSFVLPNLKAAAESAMKATA